MMMMNTRMGIMITKNWNSKVIMINILDCSYEEFLLFLEYLSLLAQ